MNPQRRGKVKVLSKKIPCVSQVKIKRTIMYLIIHSHSASGCLHSDAQVQESSKVALPALTKTRYQIISGDVFPNARSFCSMFRYLLSQNKDQIY